MLLLLTSLFMLAAGMDVFAQLDSNFAPVPKPLNQWKYGWQDGMRANTLGSAKNGDPLPKGTTYLDTGYAPDQIAKAYGYSLLSTNGDGHGQTIALIEAYGNTNAQHDLDTFCLKFQIPSTKIETYYPNGIPILTLDNKTNWSGWAAETSLDVEWAHAVAPGAKIVLVVDKDAGGTDQCVDFAVTNLNANIISMSYGTKESDYSNNSELTEDSYFQATGVSYLAAAGDANDVNYPATSPYVIGVGGTRLLMNNGIFTESAWSSTGGGLSIYESLPSYQASRNINSFRMTPDVSCVADTYTGVSVYFTDPTLLGSGSWIVQGGTSLSTPVFAGIMARRASLGFSNNGFLSLIYSKQTNSWPLKDITNGYHAFKGYDLSTGLGSPRVDQLVTLTSNSITDALPQSITFPSIPTKTYKNPPFRVTATASSKLPVKFGVISGPAILSGNLVTLTGGGTVTLAANQPGNLTWDSAQEVTNSFVVNPTTQAILFPAVALRRYSTNPIILSARASSKLPVSYSVTSGPASLSGSNTILSLGVGTLTVEASQAGNATYLPASKSINIRVIKALQKITPFTPIPAQIITNAPFSIPLPTSSSGLPVTVAVKSGPASIGGNLITLSGIPGTVILTANQSGDTNYLAAPQVVTSFVVKAK